MQLRLDFKNIIDYPKYRIAINDGVVYDGEVLPVLAFNADDAEHCVLTIEHYGKVHNDNPDQSFELHEINVDGYDLGNLMWDSEFICVDGKEYPGCLFFGPNGTFTIEFELPILKYILSKTSVGWEEDYEYYMRSLEIIKGYVDG